MGMFDYVICEVELPDGYDPGDHGFQTKDFDRVMTTIKITADGRLEMFFYDFAYDGEYRLIKNGVMVPRFKRINERWVEYHEHDGSLFDGHFCFYDYDDQDQWHQYVAKFTNGQLEEIVIVPDRFSARRKNQ